MVKRKLLVLFLILCITLVGCSDIGESSEPSIEQMKADLIGHILTTGEGTGWAFAALSEFEHFDIRGKQEQGDVIEYDVSMRLVDLVSDIHFLADVLIIYKHIHGEWELAAIVTKLYKYLY